MPAPTGEARNAIDALYSVADSLSEQRVLLRQIAANTSALLELWRNTTSPGETTEAAAPEPIAAPAPAPQAPPAQSSPMDAMLMGLISKQLGIDPTALKGMSENDVMAMVAARLSTNQAGGAAPPIAPT